MSVKPFLSRLSISYNATRSSVRVPGMLCEILIAAAAAAARAGAASCQHPKINRSNLTVTCPRRQRSGI